MKGGKGVKETVYRFGGTDVYVLPAKHLHSFCIGVYLMSGSMYEQNGQNGITHLYEHSVFRNIKKRYDRDLYELLTENGITFNASTYKEFVYFEIAGLPSGFDFAADLVEGLFDPLVLTSNEYNAEKRRIKAEIREEGELSTLQYFADARVWEGTALSNTISGSCTTLDRISLKALNRFREETVTEGNVFVYVTGNVTKGQIEKLERAVSKMNISRGGAVRDNTAPVPKDFGRRRPELHVKQSDYCLVRMSFDIDNRLCDAAVRDLIYSALFEGEDAMFFQKMSEKESLIYSYDSNLEQYRNISCIKLQYEISPKNLVPSVECAVDILQELKRGNFNFDNCLKKLLTKWELMRDEAANLNWAMAYTNHILGNCKIDLCDKMMGLYGDADIEAVRTGACRIFTRDNLVCAVKGRKKDVNAQVIDSVLDRLDKEF